MAFVKADKGQRWDFVGSEIVADAFTITGGTPVSSATRQAAIAAITVIATADATDLTTAEALANATKAKVNALIAALQT